MISHAVVANAQTSEEVVGVVAAANPVRGSACSSGAFHREEHAMKEDTAMDSPVDLAPRITFSKLKSQMTVRSAGNSINTFEACGRVGHNETSR